MKKSVLVGINKYELEGNNLSGCVNDVTNVRDILINYYGFEIPNIRVLVDERATKCNIMERLGWLVDDAKSGDNLVFHFSGHGSQIRERGNGDELDDSLDEIICPTDMDWEGTYITDDELAEMFKRLPAGITLDVILDSCHSGTATRNPFKVRYMQPPVDILCRNEENIASKGLFSWIKGFFVGKKKDDTMEPINDMNHSLMAGCQSKQTSADAYLDSSYNGAFTYYLCKTIRAENGKINRIDLRNKTKGSLEYNGFDQSPQLETNKELFYGNIFR